MNPANRHSGLPVGGRARSMGRVRRRHSASAEQDRVWLLDLDNTLHDAKPEIFPRINLAMTDYVARRLGMPHDEASALRVHYWQRYGATLLGMVHHHGIDAHEFLRETHPFPDLHRIVDRSHALREMLRRLPGRKIVLTNAPNAYARGVLRGLGIAAQLDGLIAIESMRFAGRFLPKPSRSMLAKLIARLRVPARCCVLVEDSPANLHAARACRLRTVVVTGLSLGAVHATGRLRAGRGRRIDVQVQSPWTLPRIVHKIR
ncbi:MAG: pyrimidine 5'-nucleotidase [Quisquiliibacterium sp.]